MCPLTNAAQPDNDGLLTVDNVGPKATPGRSRSHPMRADQETGHPQDRARVTMKAITPTASRAISAETAYATYASTFCGSILMLPCWRMFHEAIPFARLNERGVAPVRPERTQPAALSETRRPAGAVQYNPRCQGGSNEALHIPSRGGPFLAAR